jgi:hypothetical protein
MCEEKKLESRFPASGRRANFRQATGLLKEAVNRVENWLRLCNVVEAVQRSGTVKTFRSNGYDASRSTFAQPLRRMLEDDRQHETAIEAIEADSNISLCRASAKRHHPYPERGRLAQQM